MGIRPGRVDGLLDKTRDVPDGPGILGDSRGHCRGDSPTEGLVGAGEVVVHVVEADGVGRFSIFLENPLVSRVNRRMPILMVRFCRST